eukprot:939254-Rhodomonas_salina.1
MHVTWTTIVARPCNGPCSVCRGAVPPRLAAPAPPPAAPFRTSAPQSSLFYCPDLYLCTAHPL